MRVLPLSAVLLGATLLSVPAMAQTAGNQGGPGSAGASDRTGAAHGRMPRGEAMQRMVERGLADLHDRLHITAQQAPQWDQFVRTVRESFAEMDQHYRERASRLGSMSALENVQSYAQLEQERVQAVQQLIPAFQTMYGSLSDQQKKIADEALRNYTARAHARRQP